MPNATESISEISTLTSQVFRILYETPDTEQAIEAVFAALGKALHVSRVYLFEDSPDHTHCSNTFEWCAPGISREKDNLQNLSYDADLGGNWHDNFDKRGLFYCLDISLLPKPQYEILSRQSIRAMLQCALMDGKTFMGYIGFDECTGARKWSQSQVDTLHSASSIIGTFLLSYREKQSLTQLLHDYSVTVNDLQNLVNYLPGGVAKYRITDRAETLYFSDGVPALTGHTREEYASLYTEDAFEIIYPGDRERLSQSVQRCLSEGTSDIYYRIRHKNGSYVWVHLHGVFVHLPGSEPLFHAVFEGVSKQSQQYIDLLNQLDEAVYLIDAESHDIIFINSAARRLFHLADGAQMSEPCYRQLFGRELPCDICRLDTPGGSGNVEYDGRPYSVKYRLLEWSGRAAMAIYIKPAQDDQQ